MKEPLLSVCIITYNHARYIRQAIEGVLKQNANFAFEVIIADDFSTDGTREILLEYRALYPDLIRLILQKANVGAAKNWKDLITTPQTKYIAYFEGDDYWTDPFKLQKQVELLEANSSFSICFHRAIERYEDSTTERIIPDGSINAILKLEDLLKGSNFIPTLSCVFRNFNVPLPSWLYQLPFGDYGLHLINAKRGDIGFVDEVMGVYRINQSGAHGKLNSTNNGLAKAYQQHVQFWEIIKQTNEFDYRLVSVAQEKAIKRVEYYKTKAKQSKKSLSSLLK